MAESYDYEEILEIKTAWYYYMEGLTQQEIGERLGISRLRVNRLLDKAKKSGMIQFHIRAGQSGRMLLEQKLIQRYHLKDAFIAPSIRKDENINENVALAAASYISDHLGKQSFINMGYGDTSSRILNHVASMSDSPVNVVALTGGVSYYLPNVQSSIFNIKLHLMPSPLIMQSSQMVSAILNEPSVQEILEMRRLAAMTVVGIGGMNENATVRQNGVLSYNDYMYLNVNGAVGDVLCHFLDADGNLVSSQIEDRLVSTSLEELKAMENVIGVAAGVYKADAILSALRGKYLDVLITDEKTAGAVLSKDTASD